jgi:plastocyanin
MNKTCAAATCGDGVANGTETDVDCGSTCPNKCADTLGCLTGADCQSGVCSANICQAPSCMDGVFNGSETDVDCGAGGSCPKCLIDKICVDHDDCTTGRCEAGVCILLNGCDMTTALDLTSETAITVNIGSTSETYTPKCYIAKAGTPVTYYGNFLPHPQTGGAIINGMVYEDSPAINPFSPEVTSGTEATYMLSTPGAYGMYCTKHWPSGFGGAAYVVP